MAAPTAQRKPRPTWDRVLDKAEAIAAVAGRFAKHPLNWFRWLLITAVPFVIGVIAKDLVQQLYKTTNFWDPAIWRPAWPIVPLLLFYGFILLWQRFHNYRVRHADRLYYSLKWFYEDMGFDKNPQADVRCTIWAPQGNPGGSRATRLKQAVDYVPRRSKVSHGHYRNNGRADRVFVVSKDKDGTTNTIGILGLCVVDSLNKSQPGIYREVIQDGEVFEDYMIRNWNFAPRQATHLTHDRRSYLCITMMDSANRNLLGVIYCDSRDPQALSEDVAVKAQKFLPRFALLLTM